MTEIEIPISLVKALKANVASKNDEREHLKYALLDKENNALVATNGHSLFKVDFDLSELPCSMLIKMPPAFFGAKTIITLKISDGYTPIPDETDYRSTEELLFEVGSEELLVSERSTNKFPDYQKVLVDDLSKYNGSNLCMDTSLLAITAKTYGTDTPVRLFSQNSETGFAKKGVIVMPAEAGHFDNAQLIIMPLNI